VEFGVGMVVAVGEACESSMGSKFSGLSEHVSAKADLQGSARERSRMRQLSIATTLSWKIRYVAKALCGEVSKSLCVGRAQVVG
jgi:hypothetical protein